MFPAVGGMLASIGGSLLGGRSRRRAARRAAEAMQAGNIKARGAMLPAIDAAVAAQTGGIDKAIGAQTAGMDRIRALLNPYVSGGQQGLTGMMALMGLSGRDAQAAAIDGIKSGSQFEELSKQGEYAILANAAATGGLRGGDTQGALAQYRPAMLQSLIDRQLAGLTGLAGMGLSASGQLSGFESDNARALGALEMDRGNAIGQGALGRGQVNAQYALNEGSIGAGQATAMGQANAGMFGGIASGIGSVFGAMKPIFAGSGPAPAGYASGTKPAFGGAFGNWSF